MSLQHWSDYHNWHVSNDALSAARLALSRKDWLALSAAADLAGPVPREAIEDAALAMLPTMGAQWLATVYQLEPGQGAHLLMAIQAVRA